MKICVTSQGQDLSAAVDPRFGRAGYLIIYDDETGSFEVIDNAANANAASGAGVQTATRVVEAGCQWVISGRVGPNALSVLKAGGVRVATGGTGTVKQALEDLRSGRLSEGAERPAPASPAGRREGGGGRGGAVRPRASRIAVPVTGGVLSPHFGRCEEFVLFDIDAEGREVGSSERLPAPPHEPGLLPQWLRERGVECIIAGGMGPRAIGLFEQSGVEVVLGAPAETPERLVRMYLDGALEAGENVCDH